MAIALSSYLHQIAITLLLYLKKAIPTVSFANASLDEVKSVILVWLDVIYQQLKEKLKAINLELQGENQ